MTPASVQTFKAGTKDFDALASGLASADVGVVYLAGSYVEGGLIARALRAAGSAAQIVSGDSLVTEDYLNQAKDAAEGTLMTFTYDPRKFPSARPVIERMRAADQNAEGFTLYAYAAVQALAAAAEGTGSMESAAHRRMAAGRQPLRHRRGAHRLRRRRATSRSRRLPGSGGSAGAMSRSTPQHSRPPSSTQHPDGALAMRAFFVQIKCELGKSYDVATAIADAEIARNLFHRRRLRSSGEVLPRGGTRTSATSSRRRSRLFRASAPTTR